MIVDILAFGAHPDDVEMTAGGGMLKMKAEGFRTGIVDLTKGELSTRGSLELREKETSAASALLQLDARENLDLGDGLFAEGQKELLAIISAIRRYQPKIILAPYPKDRHPDHERCSRLVRNANFYAGLAKYPAEGLPHRAKQIYYYMANSEFKPSFILDISDYFEGKLELFEAYGSQFYKKNQTNEAATPISRPEFLEYIKARARFYGEQSGVLYGEPYFIEGLPRYSKFLEL
jgi:bacillithiol biosynthesis deacetylase BshB1